jgi:hypothetical protein
MPEQVQLRDQARQTADGLQVGSPEHEFYKAIEGHAMASIRDQLARDEEISDD